MKKELVINNIDASKINYLYYDRKINKTMVVMDDHTQSEYAYSCKKILERLSMKYGSTLKGRIEYCSYTLKIYKKIPLIISERNEIIIFPLYGYRNKEAMWISFGAVKKVYNEENLTTKITFKNNDSIHVNINYRSINGQMRRCKRLIKIMNDL